MNMPCEACGECFLRLTPRVRFCTPCKRARQREQTEAWKREHPEEMKEYRTAYKLRCRYRRVAV